jgi:hypothetical protein
VGDEEPLHYKISSDPGSQGVGAQRQLCSSARVLRESAAFPPVTLPSPGPGPPPPPPAQPGRPEAEGAPARSAAGGAGTRACPARGRDGPRRLGVTRSPDRMGTLGMGTATFRWAQEVSRVPDGGAEVSKWKTEKTPPSLSPGSLPRGGLRAPGNLPSKRPPHTNTQTHPYRAPQPRVAGVGRGSALGEPGGKWGASHPGRKSCSQETLPPNARPGDSRWKGWLDTVEADRYRKEAGAFLEKESGPAEKQARPLEEEIPELEVRRLFCVELPGPN